MSINSLSKERTVRHCQSKEASIMWSHHEETRMLPGERDNARNNAMQVHAGEEDHARPGWTTSIVNTRTELPVKELIRMTEDRDKWRKYVHGVANPRIDDS